MLNRLPEGFDRSDVMARQTARESNRPGMDNAVNGQVIVRDYEALAGQINAAYRQGRESVRLQYSCNRNPREYAERLWRYLTNLYESDISVKPSKSSPDVVAVVQVHFLDTGPSNG